MSENKNIFPYEFLELLKSINNKRARVVIDHIMEHGFITTDDLKNTYNYLHPPRAPMDVKDLGVPIDTYKVKSEISGKQISAYKFGDLSQLQSERVKGRILFSKAFKKLLYTAAGGKCQICNGQLTLRALQIDHRVPYEVSGDLTDRGVQHFMLLCASCNRAKSWSCEHCENWLENKLPALCMECYWGSPESYNHIALQQIRRLDIVWNNDEVKYYDAIKKMAEEAGIELPAFIKDIVSKL